MSDWYYKKYCLGLIRVQHPGFMSPWWLGFCYRRCDLSDMPSVLAPIPFNWLIGFMRVSWMAIVMARPIDRWQKWLTREDEIQCEHNLNSKPVCDKCGKTIWRAHGITRELDGE